MICQKISAKRTIRMNESRKFNVLNTQRTISQLLHKKIQEYGCTILTILVGYQNILIASLITSLRNQWLSIWNPSFEKPD